MRRYIDRQWMLGQRPNLRTYIGPESLQEIFGATWWDPDTWNFGDEPIDHQAVNLGIGLWKKYQDRMTKGQFETELATNIENFARCTPDPGPVGNRAAAAWPYQVGHFNHRLDVTAQA